MDRVSITEAARRLGISEKTVRRRLEIGELAGEKLPRPQGYTWIVYLDEAHADDQEGYKDSDQLVEIVALRTRLQEQDRLIAVLERQLAEQKEQLSQKDWQIGQILQDLRELRQLALPAPKKPGLWRRIWRRTP